MKLKKLLYTAGVLALTVAVAGCGLVRVNEDKDKKIVVAEVNGTEILKGQFTNEWDRALISYGGSIPEEQQEQVRDNILESLIQNELIMQKAKAAGFEVTNEIREEARTDYEKEVEAYARDLQEAAKEEAEKEESPSPNGEETDETAEETATAADENAEADNAESSVETATEAEGTAADEDAEAEATEEDDKTAEEEKLEQKYIDQAKKEISDWLEMMKLTEDEYIELIARSKVIEAFIEDQTKDVSVEENEIQSFYDKALKDQREYPSALQYGNYYFPVIVLKTPASRTVKHILIKIPDEDKAEIANLRKENKEDEADALLEEKLKEIEDKANDVLNKAKSGENFEELIKEYGEDPGMENEAYKDGYVLYKDGSFVKTFEDASYELEKGEISGLVPSDNGYHIIKLYEITEEEVLPLDEVKDDIVENLKAQKRNEKWDEILKGWLDKADIKRYKNRLD